MDERGLTHASILREPRAQTAQLQPFTDELELAHTGT
jgi:hypothetical protein